jgi:hypothetical protein
MHQWFFKFLGCPVEILLASMKILTTFKNWPGSLIIISVLATHSVIGRFSPESTPHWMHEKSA